jgi:hypothetical protein
LEKAWRDQAGVAPLSPGMVFGPEGLTLGAGTVLASVDGLTEADERGEARLYALLSAAYRQPIGPQAIRYIRRGAASWRAGDEAMAAMHLAMTGLMPLRNVKDAARRLFMADMLMKAGTGPDVILRALDLPGAEGEGALTRYVDQEYRNPKGSGRVSGRWAREGEPAAAQGGTIKPQGAAPARVKPGLALSPRSPVKAPPVDVPSAAATVESDSEGLAVLSDADAFTALASMGGRLSAPTVFFSTLLIPYNRTAPDKIAIPGYPTMHLERGIGDRLWRFVYQDREGNQHTAVEKDGGFITTVEGRIVGRIDHRGGIVLTRAALDAVTGAMTAYKGPDLCPAAEPDRPGQGSTGEARDYENHVKRVVNPYRPTPNALAYYLRNPDARDGRTSFDDCQHETGVMIEAKGPGFTRILNKAQARLAKDRYDVMGNNVVNDLDRQGELQVAASKLAGNRPIIWFFHDQEALNYTKERFKAHGHGLENINFVWLP